jgi:hypothetical protein
MRCSFKYSSLNNALATRTKKCSWASKSRDIFVVVVVNINFGREISTTIVSLKFEYTPSLLNYKPRLII